MFETFDKKLVALAASAGLACSLGMSAAHADSHGGKPYLQSGGGDTVTTGAGECWSSTGAPVQMLELCGDTIAAPKAMAAAPASGDADGDGVADAQDECPNTPKGVAVTAFGCPRDADGDGVADFLDKCPGTARGAKVGATGCAMAGMAMSVTADNFPFDSSELQPAQEAKLAEAASKVRGSGQRVEVVGHTDSTGPENYNQMLSERRAQAAADYLTGLGVGNMTVKGMGESAPVADNGTRAGRAANRRVEVNAQ